MDCIWSSWSGYSTWTKLCFLIFWVVLVLRWNKISNFPWNFFPSFQFNVLRMSSHVPTVENVSDPLGYAMVIMTVLIILMKGTVKVKNNDIYSAWFWKKKIPATEVVEAVEVIEAAEVPDWREITQYVKCKVSFSPKRHKKAKNVEKEKLKIALQ